MGGIDGMTRARRILLAGTLAAACTSAACGGAPGAPPPARSAPSAVATAAERETGKLVMSGPRKRTPPPERASAETVIATYLQAARQHRIEAMLDCFTPRERAEEASKPGSITRALSRPTLAILSHRATGASGDSWRDYDGPTHEAASILMAVETEEAGRRETLEVGFQALEVDGAWFLTAVMPGSELAL